MILLHTCDRCTQEADHRIEKADKKVLHLCWDCYNAYLCERLGLDISTYSHPKTIAVDGQRFKVKAEVYEDGVTYYAYKGKGNALKTISFMAPLEMDGITAMEELKERVSRFLITPTLIDEILLAPMGVFGIEYDEDTLDQMAFIIDGERYDSEDFLELLQDYRGSNFIYVTESRIPPPDAQFFGREDQ